MRKKKSLFVICFYLLLSNNFLYSQSNLYGKSIEFAQYLNNKKLYKESIYVLHSMLSCELKFETQDSIRYLLANNYTAIDSLHLASVNYLLVSKNSSYFNIANYKMAINFLKKDKFDSIELTLKNLDTFYSNSKEYLVLINNAVAIKQKKYSNYNADFLKNTNNYTVYNANINIYNSYKKALAYKKKSPFVAGTLSAIVPGLGKWYAGKPGEFLGSLLPLTAMFFLCKEAYKNDGASSIPFIGLTSVTTIFYLGNIYGSVVSIKSKNNQFYNKINNEVLVSLDFPVGK